MKVCCCECWHINFYTFQVTQADDSFRRAVAARSLRLTLSKPYQVFLLHSETYLLSKDQQICIKC